jgi:glycine hydroxymethyltransferase
MKNGLTVLTGGTDNHLILVNVHELKGSAEPISGRQAESALHECNITVNRHSLPGDPNGPWYTAGLRIGTAAVTSLGMGRAELEEIGALISLVLKNTGPARDARNPEKPSKAKYVIAEGAKAEALDRVKKLLDRFPVYPELDLKFLKKSFCGG